MQAFSADTSVIGFRGNCDEISANLTSKFLINKFLEHNLLISFGLDSVFVI